MISFTVAFFLALLVSAVLTPVVRNLSFKLGFYDEPNDRKVHSRAIPRTGGVAIAAAFLVPVAGIVLTEAEIGNLVYRNVNYMLGIMAGGIAVMLLGLADDLKGLGAKTKFGVQILVATFAFFMGFRIEMVSLPFGGSLDMGIFSYLITVLWIVGIINALNLIDGLDGLAAGVAFFVMVFNFVVGYFNDSVLIGLVAASMAGAILGFLFYNFNPASIFMGDAGSMFIGYVLALAAINSGQKSSTTVALLTPVVAMGLPIMDTLFSIVRRFLERRPLFSPDRGHIHHRLMRMGLNHRRVVVILYGTTVMLVLVAALLHFGGQWQIGVGLLVMFVTFAVFARVLGMAEYVTKRRAYRMGARSRHAEILRNHVFEAMRRAAQVKGEAEIAAFFEWFVVRMNMKFMEFYPGEDKAAEHSVENPDYPETSREPLLTVDIPLYDRQGREFAHVRVGWYSERGKVTTATETLLQVVMDRLAEGLAATSAVPDGEIGAMK